jgi:GABA permease
MFLVTPDRTPDNAREGAGTMGRYLVVANQTLDGEHLLSQMRVVHGDGAASFFVVVPATPVVHNLHWTEGESRCAAQQRLDAALDRFGAEGFNVAGEVGDQDPVLAVADACRRRTFDGVIVSTLPPGISRWVRRELPRRVERATGLPVTHVVARQPAAVKH